MIRIKEKHGKIKIRMDEGQDLIISNLTQLTETVKMIESCEELDFHQARGIIDFLLILRKDFVKQRELRCIPKSSWIRAYEQNIQK
jgi:hypothetical protein